MLALYWTELHWQALQTGFLNAAAAAAEVAAADLAAVADDHGSDLAAAAYDPVAAAVADADPADWVQASCHAAGACLQECLGPALPDQA